MKKTLCILITFFLTNSLYSQSFTIDNDFNIGSGFNDSAIVNQIAIQQDGKIIVAGTNFLQLNGVNISSNIIRLNSNGTLDIQFTNSITIPKSIVIQSNDKIIVAGDSSTNNTRIVRYNSDGTLDNTFSIGINSTDGFNVGIDEIALENDGKILVKGGFTTYSGNSIKRLVRLNIDGTLYLPLSGITFNIRGFKLLNSGKILVSQYGTNLLKRINNDGTVDNTYNSINSYSPFLFQELSDNNILSLQKDGAVTVSKLYQNGGFDNTSFTPYVTSNSGSIISSINTLANNKILLTSSSGSNEITLLNLNGSIDNSNNFGIGFDQFNFANCAKVQNDNKIIFGGNFNSYNGVTKYSLVRVINSSLSTQQNKTEKVLIFPNPAKEIIRISDIKNFNYEINDLLGKKILQNNNCENEINISSLAKGMYILKIENEGKISIQQFTKN